MGVFPPLEGFEMILWMIALGVVLGRWPWAAVVTAAVVWPIALISGGVLGPDVDPWSTLALGSLLAVLNAGVGVLVHQAVLWSYRGLRRWIRRPHVQP